MVIGNEASWQDQTPEERKATYDQMDVFNREMIDAGVYQSAAGLQELAAAKTVRFGEGVGPVVTDGPFAEAKEQLAGYWLIECANIDEALGWAKKAPMEDAAIEIRPLVEE